MKDERDAEIKPENIKEITLLSIDEYENCKNIIPLIHGRWWLRSPGYYSDSAAYVDSSGRASAGYNLVNNNHVCVRPALRLNLSNLHRGDTATFAGHRWTVISSDIALCDESIGRHYFRENWEAEDANDYDESDVKVFLEEWLEQQNIQQNFRTVNRIYFAI